MASDAMFGLAPFTTPSGKIVNPGCFGVSHGQGLAGELIRYATNSWAGHAFVYVGNGHIVEGLAPIAQVSNATTYPDAVWNIREQLTDTQRGLIVAKAHALVGTPYDWVALAGFAIEILHIRSGSQLDGLYKQDHWRVCSALVADCYSAAGLTIDAGLEDPNLVSPADLYNRILAQGS